MLGAQSACGRRQGRRPADPSAAARGPGQHPVGVPRPGRPLPVSPPLRILAMISAPSDISELSGDDEWSKLNDALMDLAGQGMVEVDRLEAGTLASGFRLAVPSLDRFRREKCL